jgi:hypothetical protein
MWNIVPVEKLLVADPVFLHAFLKTPIPGLAPVAECINMPVIGLRKTGSV